MTATRSAAPADTHTVTHMERPDAQTLPTSLDYDEFDEHDDRIESSSHAGTCSSCDAYPVPTQGGLCPSCRLPVETVTDPCGCSGSERSAS